jgi:hypothetical protein
VVRSKHETSTQDECSSVLPLISLKLQELAPLPTGTPESAGLCAFGPFRNLIRVTAHQLSGLAVRINSAGLCDSTRVKSGGHTERMNEITREEFNAKLETIEVKMDARVESVSAKIDGFLFAQAERDKRLDATLSQISANHAETQSSLGSMKTAMVGPLTRNVLIYIRYQN